MMRRLDPRLAGAILIALLVVLPFWAVEAQGAGILEGQVENGTPGGPDVGAGIPVTLSAFRDDLQVDEWETVTGAEGSFRFEGLDPDEELEYWLAATYLDVVFTTPDAYQFQAGEMTIQASATVYETTTDDDSGIGINLAVFRIQSMDSLLRVQESYYFGNSGDRAYIGRTGQLAGGQRATVRIPLPEDLFGLDLGLADGAAQAFEVEGAAVGAEPVPPGEGTSYLSISYHLPVPASGLVALERTLAYPIEAVWVLAAQPGLQLQSDLLLSQGVTELEDGQPVEFFVGENLAAGSSIVMELETDATGASSAMPGTSTAGAQGESAAAGRGHQKLLGWAGIGLVALMLIAAVVYPAASRPLAAVPARRPDLRREPRARRLVAELADLEDACEAGDLDQASYERRRSDIHRAIRSLWD